MVDLAHLRQLYARLDDDELHATLKKDLEPEARAVIQEELAQRQAARAHAAAHPKPAPSPREQLMAQVPKLLSAPLSWCTWTFWVGLLIVVSSGALFIPSLAGLGIVYLIGLFFIRRGLLKLDAGAAYAFIAAVAVLWLVLGLYVVAADSHYFAANSGRAIKGLAFGFLWLGMLALAGLRGVYVCVMALRKGLFKVLDEAGTPGSIAAGAGQPGEVKSSGFMLLVLVMAAVGLGALLGIAKIRAASESAPATAPVSAEVESPSDMPTPDQIRQAGATPAVAVSDGPDSLPVAAFYDSLTFQPRTATYDWPGGLKIRVVDTIKPGAVSDFTGRTVTETRMAALKDDGSEIANSTTYYENKAWAGSFSVEAGKKIDCEFVTQKHPPPPAFARMGDFGVLADYTEHHDCEASSTPSAKGRYFWALMKDAGTPFFCVGTMGNDPTEGDTTSVICASVAGRELGERSLMIQRKADGKEGLRVEGVYGK